VTGYLHPDYAASLGEFGAPHCLPRSRGWILVRNIPDSGYQDAMGCYPLFACENWSELAADLDELRGRLVSLALVADPFGNHDLPMLERCFEKVIPFKEHFVVDLTCPVDRVTTSHHRYYTRKALRKLTVEHEADPSRLLEVWTGLYARLIEKHNVTGLRAFSHKAFARQLRVPGITAFRAMLEEEIIGMHLWYVQNDVGYSHLEAMNEAGYSLGAAYALYWSALEFFSGRLRWLDLGAGAGMRSDAEDGLSAFKKGWSTGKRTAFFCGRILDAARYAQLASGRDVAKTNYFPAYRAGEFV